MKTEDYSGGARSKDECGRGANEERCSGSGSGSHTPKEGAKNRERYCLLFGVELIPAPRERAGSRAVPPHAWTNQILWDYISPYVPGVTRIIAINAMEFIVFRGSRSNGEGIPQREAIALAYGMEGNETLWMGKPVTIHCTPRMLREAAADLAAFRNYVRRRTLDHINKQRKKHAAWMQQDVMEDPTSPRTPRGCGMVRRMDRYVAEHHHRHQVGVAPQDRPLYAARENSEWDGPERMGEARIAVCVARCVSPGRDGAGLHLCTGRSPV